MQSNKSDFLWNMLGSLANATSSMLLLMFAGRSQGEVSAGIFSISLAISQLFATIGLFEVRTYQSSDLKEQFKFKDYFTLRIITCFIMFVFSLVYILIYGYTGMDLQIIIMMCIYKGLDAFSDVSHGLFQQKNKLNIAGKSLFFRVVGSTIIFLITVYQFESLLFPILFMNIFSLLWIIVFDLYQTYKLEKDWVTCQLSNIRALFIECLPLCICSFISIYLINSPKYAIGTYATNEIQGIFGYIFMPTAVINLFSIFVLRPIIGDLSTSWGTANIIKFMKLVKLIVIWIVILTLITLISGFILGIPILSWFYAMDLSAYKYELMIILIGGGFSALSTAIYYILTVMRQQKKVFFTYSIVFLLVILTVPKLTQFYGLVGASYGYLFAMVLLDLGLIVTFKKSLKYINNNMHKENEDD